MRFRCCLFIVLASCCASPVYAAGDLDQAALLATATDGTDWPVKGGNARGQHYSVLDQINDHSVGNLGLAWATDIDSTDGLAGTPIIVDGVIYLSAAFSIVYAINASDGTLLWRFDPDVRGSFAARPNLSWSARANQGVAVWGGKVYVTTADCRLIAVDAASGKAAWSQQTCDTTQGYSISDSPYVGNDKVFVGNGGSESGKKIRGYVSAYAAGDGQLLWRFYTVPSDDPEENMTAAMKMAAATWSGDALAKYGGGGNSWNEMTYDPETGLLFFGTAGALPYVHAIRSPAGGDNLFLSSVIAVHADTGEYAWHYQTVPQDSWDYNATMNIALDEFAIDGHVHKTLMIAPKNGFHYVLDRETGELLAADKFARVNWASRINLETGRPVYSDEAVYWQSDSETEVTVWPNMWGAHGRAAMAWHPGYRLAYIPVADVPDIVSNFHDGDFDDTLEMVTQVDGAAFSPGKLVAFDPLAGKARWTVEQELPFNGGVLATAGNLVFQGDAQGRFSAYAADDGNRLWSVLTGTAITAAPATCAIDGEQFVVVPIGPGGGIQYFYPQMQSTEQSRGPTRLLAFSLHGDVTLPSPVEEQRPLPDLPDIATAPEDVSAGAHIYELDCKGCHGDGAFARPNGSVPDLRYASADTFAGWHGIVIGGSLRANGMPVFDISIADSEKIRAYVLSRARELRGGGAGE